MEVNVLNDRLLVKQKVGKTQTDSGLHLPSSIVADEEDGKALVVAIGPGKTLEDGTIKPMSIKEGDLIAYNPHSGAEVKIEGETYRILNEGDVFLVLGNILK